MRTSVSDDYLTAGISYAFHPDRDTWYSARCSIDFRTVNLDDVEARRGADNVDSGCTGTTMREYLRVTDLEHVPDEPVEMYDDESAREVEGDLVFQAQGS